MRGRTWGQKKTVLHPMNFTVRYKMKFGIASGVDLAFGKRPRRRERQINLSPTEVGTKEAGAWAVGWEKQKTAN